MKKKNTKILSNYAHAAVTEQQLAVAASNTVAAAPLLFVAMREKKGSKRIQIKY